MPGPLDRPKALAKQGLSWYHAHDPAGNGWHRGVRVAVLVPAVFAFTFEVIGNPQIALFAAFGVVALLLFVDFPGNRAARLASYVMLALAGVVLITLGTLCSRNEAVAVISMGVVAFLVLFSGILSSALAAAGRAALLLFILPVNLPVPISQIPPRLAGWGIAAGVAIPVAILVWPPKEYGNIRRFAAEVCAGIERVITNRAAGGGSPGDADCAAMSESLEALRRAFRSTLTRPVGLTSGSRLLIRLVDELEWLTAITANLTSAELQRWSELARLTALRAADVLGACASVLRNRRGWTAEADALIEALSRLGDERRQAAAGTRALLASPAPDDEAAWPYRGHEVAYATSLVGFTVELAAEADARPVLHRLLGRPAARRQRAQLSPAVDIARSQFDWHSVWLHNSLRGALGLALAVLFAKLTGAQHAFWVVLGALSMLRSNALTTGATVVRVLIGTLVGIAVGSLLVLAIGTSTAVLWAFLPPALFLASLAPDVISFAAGQAGFTLVLLILFNIIAPVGWSVGLVRLEDVALGAAASLIVGILLWPRGAAASIGAALGHAYRVAASYLEHAVNSALGLGQPPNDELREVMAADRRLDDAFRQYLAERGPKNVPVRDLTVAANGAVRIRLAGEAIAGLRRGEGSAARPPRPLAPSVGVVQLEVTALRDYYLALADEFEPRSRRGALPPETEDGGEGEVLESIRRDVAASAPNEPAPDDAAPGDPAPERRAPPDNVEVLAGARLLFAALYLQDMRILEGRLRTTLTGSEVVGQEGRAAPAAAAEPAASPAAPAAG
jgi:Fusaric acid resistance protein-like